MNVLYITPYYKPSWFYGGPPKCIAEQAEYLATHHGMKLDVLTLNINGAKPLYDTSEPLVKDVDGVTVHYLPVSNGKFGRAYFDSDYLQEYIKKFSNADLIHVHTLFNAFSRKGMQFAVKKNIPYIVTPHGMLDSFSLTRSEWMKKIHRYLYDDNLLSRAKAVQFTTKNELKSSIIKKTVQSVIIPLGFEFSKDEMQKQSRAENKLKLVFLGRVNRKKGIDRLVKGMAKIERSVVEKITVDIYGADDDNCKSELDELINASYLKKNITFCGSLDPAIRDEKLKGYDCLVLTSHQENFGLVVVEALAMGLPVYISDKVNLCDFVLENDCGWVSTLDTTDISQTLQEILNTDIHTRYSKGGRGYNAVRTNFSMKDVALQYVDLYNKSVNLKETILQ